LGVLAAPAVEQAYIGIMPVALTLTTHTKANARQRPAAGLGDGLVAFLTMGQALTTWKTGTSPFKGIIHSTVDLLLYCAIF